MTISTTSEPELMSRLINRILAVKPLNNFAKHQARQMMIKRAENMGIPWRQQTQTLLSRNWDTEFSQVQNPHLQYPDYYVNSFHAYDTGNLSWQAAVEVEVAAYSVHAKIWPEAGAKGDAKLRQSYHNILKAQLATPPQDIIDLGCSVGMSTFALQEIYPEAKITGVDLSPYFLAVATYNTQKQSNFKYTPKWVHATAESTGLPSASFDLVSLCLICHELPQSPTREILQEARRLLRPNGHLAIMDMNPQSEMFKQMPPYIFTLLKSTEPYLDEYFTLDMEQAIIDAGFQRPSVNFNSPRHRTIIASVA